MNPEYQNACFRATLPPHGWPSSFGIITACNPDGKTLSDKENADATEQLAADLHEKKNKKSTTTKSAPQKAKGYEPPPDLFPPAQPELLG